MWWSPSLTQYPQVPSGIEFGSEEHHDWIDKNATRTYGAWWNEAHPGVPLPKYLSEFRDRWIVDTWYEFYRWNPKEFLRDCVKIRTKEGLLVPLDIDNPKYCRAQNLYLDIWMEQWIRQAMVRIVACKARQVGVSTVTKGLELWVLTFHAYDEGMTVADDNIGSEYLLQMLSEMRENLPLWIRPKTDRNAMVALSFDGFEAGYMEKYENRSRYSITTANNPNAGRKRALRLFHGSEVAFWGKDADRVSRGVKQSLSDSEGTVSVWESSPMGYGSFFHKRVLSAEKGEGGWRLYFCGWYLVDEYRLKDGDIRLNALPENQRSVSGFQRIMDEEGIESPSLSLDDDEKILVRECGCDAEQILWRRYCIIAKCDGDVFTFREEYPSNIQEAFIAAGSPTFAQRPLIKSLEKALSDNKKCAPGTYELIQEDDLVYHAEDTFNGRMVVYAMPEEDHEYILSADPSGGAETYVDRNQSGDNTAIIIRDRHRKKVVARYQGRMPPDTLAQFVFDWAVFYNWAIVAPENNAGWAGALIRKFKMECYPALYQTIVYDEKTEEEKTQLGWNSNRKSRNMAITTAKQRIRSGSEDLSDPVLIEELMSMQNKILPSGDIRAEARSGAHDDVAMAWIINVQVDEDMGEVDPIKEKKAPSAAVNFRTESILSLMESELAETARRNGWSTEDGPSYVSDWYGSSVSS